MKRRGWWIALVVVMTATTIGLQLHGYEICEPTQSGHEYCSPHNFVVFCFFKFLHFLNAGGAVLTTLSTIAIAVFTWTLWRTTVKLWQAGGRQLEIADATASAAKKSADVAEQAMISDRRPWLKINSVTHKGLPPDGADDIDGGYNIALAVKNIGNSPAVCIYAAAAIAKEFPDDAYIKRTIQNLRRENPSQGITLVPTDSETVEAYCLPNDNIDARTTTKLGLMICCVYYSFPFVASRQDGYFVSVCRVTRESLEWRDIRLSLEQISAHAE